MSIVLVSGDLMFQAKIIDTAKHFKIDVHIARSAQDAKDAMDKHKPELVMLDITLDIEPLKFVRELKNDPKYSKYKILAFGPHVERDLFAALKHVKCDQVMSRSRLNVELAQILGSLGNKNT